jgi:hypothetical protein
LLAVDSYPPSALPTLLHAVSAMRAPPNWALLDKLEKAATGSAHLFTAQEVVMMVQAAAALGPRPLPAFVAAMQQRAIQAFPEPYTLHPTP